MPLGGGGGGLKNVGVLCQINECHMAYIQHNTHLCGMSSHNKFPFKTSAVTSTHSHCALTDMNKYQQFEGARSNHKSSMWHWIIHTLKHTFKAGFCSSVIMLEQMECNCLHRCTQRLCHSLEISFLNCKP